MLLDSDGNRILHMIEAAHEALDYARRRRHSKLQTDRPFQHLLIRDLIILGEAASRLSSELREAHPEIPWRDMIDTRNRLIHAYFDIDMEIVWTSVREDLPELIGYLQAIRDQAAY